MLLPELMLIQPVTSPVCPGAFRSSRRVASPRVAPSAMESSFLSRARCAASHLRACECHFRTHCALNYQPRAADNRAPLGSARLGRHHCDAALIECPFSLLCLRTFRRALVRLPGGRTNERTNERTKGRTDGRKSISATFQQVARRVIARADNRSAANLAGRSRALFGRPSDEQPARYRNERAALMASPEMTWRLISAPPASSSEPTFGARLGLERRRPSDGLARKVSSDVAVVVVQRDEQQSDALEESRKRHIRPPDRRRRRRRRASPIK